MKPVRFDYLVPESVEEAVRFLTERRDEEPKLLAGGQSLVPTMNMRLARPGCLIDLNRIPALRGINRDGGQWRIGAMTRHSAVEDSSELAADVPLIPAVVTNIGYRQIRNRGTVGGSVCHADPAAEWPMLVRVLRAELDVVGPEGSRVVAADEFFEGNFTTTLADAEMLTAIRFDSPRPPWRWGFSEFAKRTGDFAIAAVAAAFRLDGSTVADASVVAAGVGPTPVRLAATEAALIGATLDDAGAAAAAADAAKEEVDPSGDIHGSADYKRHLVGVQVGRVIAQARAQGTQGGSDGAS